jgi:hypothetical protein
LSATEIEIASALQSRMRLQQRQNLTETPEERMARFAQLQAASFELLRSSPAGLAHFLQRNLHSRRVKVIDGQWRPVSTDRCLDEASS